ncbi:Flp family type IVb pilin [Thalassomonas sp. M1454]|nr:Flp family type IVb pilin [Thalassomonas sp. M1454]
MRKLKNLFTEFIEDESGLTAVEYAIAGSLVVGGMVVAFSDLGQSAKTKIGDLCEAAGTSASTCTQ